MNIYTWCPTYIAPINYYIAHLISACSHNSNHTALIMLLLMPAMIPAVVHIDCQPKV